MREPDAQSHTVFGLRVEKKCDHLGGLFHPQDVTDAFINGLSEIIQSHVLVLDGQFPNARWQTPSPLPRCIGTGSTSFGFHLSCRVFRRLGWHMPRPCQLGTPMLTAPFRLPNRGPGHVLLLRGSRLIRGPITAATVTSPVTLLPNALSRIGRVKAAILIFP